MSKSKLQLGKCKIRGCTRDFLASGYCLKHYLIALDEVQERGKKSKLLIR